MKSVLTVYWIIILLLTFGTKANSQVVAIGHVSAEVVESVSASAKAVTGFNLKNNFNTRESAIADCEKLDLGTMTINSGSNIACNMVIHSAQLSDSRGNRFKIDPAISCNAGKAKADGTQTIHINGTPVLEQGQESGLYKGTYTMVFAYN